MPWTAKQQHVAQAVAHGWKPTGTAKGFSPKFAREVVDESKTMPTRPAVKRRKYGRNVRDLLE